MAASDPIGGTAVPAEAPRAKPYAYYALALLILANFFNYFDRHIVSVLAQHMQSDLKFTDAQLGFLLGTAFAVFYGVFGIAMGRIADALRRTRLMAFGLVLWSGMTFASGLATSFGGLAAARMGVGIGEATANPVSHSLLSDYFPRRNRSTVLGAYLASVHLGVGGSLVVGGLLLSKWSSWCGILPGNACTLADWRAVYMLVGLPGILLALLIFTLREPPCPPQEKPVPAGHLIWREVSAALPPFTLFNLAGVGGARAVVRNLILAVCVVMAAALLIAATGDWAQWIAIGIGAYSVASFAQGLALRDAALHRATFGSRTFMRAMFGGALLACIVGSVQLWAAPYALRSFGGAAATTGAMMGFTALVTAIIGTLGGGFLTDRWKLRDERAPIWMGMIALLVPLPALAIMLTATSLTTYVLGYGLFTLLSSCWSGAFAGLVQDLVAPRMRAATAAIFALVMIVISAGIGPYWAGRISQMTGSLTTGLFSLLTLAPFSAILLFYAARSIRAELAAARAAEAARAAG